MTSPEIDVLQHIRTVVESRDLENTETYWQYGISTTDDRRIAINGAVSLPNILKVWGVPQGQLPIAFNKTFDRSKVIPLKLVEEMKNYLDVMIEGHFQNHPEKRVILAKNQTFFLPLVQVEYPNVTGWNDGVLIRGIGLYVHSQLIQKNIDIKKMILQWIENKLNPDRAQVSPEGGIDFKSDQMSILETKNQTGAMPDFRLDPAQMAALTNAQGFTPVITRIKENQDVRAFLGL